jgi:hypothetical protein
MENENSAAQPRTLGRKTLSVLLRVGVSLLALYFIAGVIWRYSGSNKWEFVGEKNGVKVYSLKQPGADLKQMKGVLRVRSTLAGLVKLMLDPAFSNKMGLKETQILERVNDQLVYSYFKAPLPFPFQTREFVVRTQSYQNPRTKEVLMEVAAAPDRLPSNSCCFRVTEMNNTIRFTPLENGQVEIEYTQNVNEGGFLPDLLLNTMRPRVMFYGLPKLQGFLDKKEYQDAKSDFITEK